MKEPKLRDTKINKKETEKMRKSAARSPNKVKITINFDSDLLEEINKLKKRIS